MTAHDASLVLRHVVVQGRRSLARPRIAQRPDSPSAGVNPSGFAEEAQAVAVSPHEAARRRGHEDGYKDGFAEGRAEGHAHGSDEARRQATQVAEQAGRDLEAHAKRVADELRQQAQDAFQTRVQTLDALIAALPSQIEARLSATQDDMLALCFEAVCRVLGDNAVRPEIVHAQLSRAMEGLRSRHRISVQLHPDDLAALERADGLRALRVAGSEVEWIASADVALGGCILVSPEGGLDARLETQLDVLRDLLLQRRAAHAAAVVPGGLA